MLIWLSKAATLSPMPLLGRARKQTAERARPNVRGGRQLAAATAGDPTALIMCTVLYCTVLHLFVL